MRKICPFCNSDTRTALPPQQLQSQQKPYKCPLCEEGTIWVYPENSAEIARLIELGYEYHDDGAVTKDCRACEKGILWK